MSKFRLLDLFLGPLDALVDPRVEDRLSLAHAEARHEPLEVLAAEQAHEVVVEGDEEARRARVALAAGAAAQLVVDAPRLVPLGAEHVEASQPLDLLVLGHPVGALGRESPLVILPRRLGPRRAPGAELRVASELDVGAAAGHVGRDGDGALGAGLGDDHRLARVVLGVQDLVADAARCEHPRQALRLLDRDRAHEDRLPRRVELRDLVADGRDLVVFVEKDHVVAVVARDRAVGGDHDDVEAVDLGELDEPRCRRSRSCRPACGTCGSSSGT